MKQMLPPKSHIHMWPQTTEKSEQVQMWVFKKCWRVIGMEENWTKILVLMTRLCQASIIVNNFAGVIDYYPRHLLRVFAGHEINTKPQTISSI